MMTTNPDHLRAMQAQIANDDREMAHWEADAILCQVLSEDGHTDLVELWRKVSKWYS